MTAKQERQLAQNASHNLPLLYALEYGPGIQSVTHDIQPTNGTQLGRTADEPSSGPKCAVYFSTLIKGPWDCFGRPRSTFQHQSTLGRVAMELTDVEGVYVSLIARLCLTGIGQKYTKALEEGISNGMSKEESRSYAFQRVIDEFKNEDATPGKQLNDCEMAVLVQKIDCLLIVALRWKGLFDAIGVPEVFLIQDDGYVQEYLEDTLDIPHIDLTDIGSMSEEEWSSVLNELLSPTLALKETCLKLSGVADMIQRLKGSDESELRTYLVEEIKRRVRGVLGDGSDLPGYPEDGDDDDDDESMADAEENQVVETVAFDSLEGIDFSCL